MNNQMITNTKNVRDSLTYAVSVDDDASEAGAIPLSTKTVSESETTINIS